MIPYEALVGTLDIPTVCGLEVFITIAPLPRPPSLSR